MSRFSSRVLGIYLVIIAALQMILYAYLYSGMAGARDWLTYQVLDSRFFWSMIEQAAIGSEPTHFTFVGFLAALWVMAIGILFILRRLPFSLYIYISSELILGLPQLLFAVPWGLLMVSEGEGVLKGLSPILLAIVFTLVPMPWAIYLAIYGRFENRQ